MHVRLILSHSAEELVFEDLAKDVGLRSAIKRVLLFINLSLQWSVERLCPLRYHRATLGVKLTSHLQHHNQQFKLSRV